MPGFRVGSVGFIGGAGGSSKSMLALQTAMSIAGGFDYFSLFGDSDIKQGPVVYITVEDSAEHVRERIYAIMKSLHPTARVDNYDPEINKIMENLTIHDFTGQFLALAQLGSDGRPMRSEDVDDILPLLTGSRAVFFDTANRISSAGGLEENSSKDMGCLVAVLEWICKQIGCACIMIHHVNKMSINGEMSQAALRGSSVIVDNARWIMLMKVLEKEEAKSIWGDDADLHQKDWVKAEVVKQNYGKIEPARAFNRGRGGVLDGKQELPKPSNSGGSTSKKSSRSYATT